MDTELCFSLLLDSIRCRVVAVFTSSLSRYSAGGDAPIITDTLACKHLRIRWWMSVNPLGLFCKCVPALGGEGDLLAVASDEEFAVLRLGDMPDDIDIVNRDEFLVVGE